MGLGMKAPVTVGKMKQRPTMPAGAAKTGPGLLKLPPGIPSMPSIRPTAKRNQLGSPVQVGKLAY